MENCGQHPGVNRYHLYLEYGHGWTSTCLGHRDCTCILKAGHKEKVHQSTNCSWLVSAGDPMDKSFPELPMPSRKPVKDKGVKTSKPPRIASGRSGKVKTAAKVKQGLK